MRSLQAQFLWYLACSALAAAVNLVVGFALVSGLGFTSGTRYPVAVGVGYCAGMAVNFLLNRRFTFQGNDRTRIQQGRSFLIVALSGLLLTSVIASLVRNLFSSVLPAILPAGATSPLLSAETFGQVVAIGVVSIYSFAGHRYMTFNRGIRSQLLKIVKSGTVKNADD